LFPTSNGLRASHLGLTPFRLPSTKRQTGSDDIERPRMQGPQVFYARENWDWFNSTNCFAILLLPPSKALEATIFTDCPVMNAGALLRFFNTLPILVSAVARGL